jgi:hypothetical protein
MSETYTPVNLLAGSNMPLVTGSVTLLTGENLSVGAVLGKITKAIGTPVGTGTGDGTVGSVAVKAAAQIGNYSLVCTAAPSEASANDAVFAVYAPDGVRLVDATQAVAYANDHLAFTISNATSADFIVGDSFVVPVEAGSGKCKIANSANEDGSAVPYAVLAADTDATDEDLTAPVYQTGEFNEDALSFGGSDDADTHREALKAIGIFLKTIA